MIFGAKPINNRLYINSRIVVMSRKSTRIQTARETLEMGISAIIWLTIQRFRTSLRKLFSLCWIIRLTKGTFSLFGKRFEANATPKRQQRVNEATRGRFGQFLLKTAPGGFSIGISLSVC
jgi:hypothetical protein